MLLFAPNHYIPRSVVTTHEQSFRGLICIVDLATLHHGLIASVSDLALVPFLYHSLQIIILLLVIEFSSVQPFERIELSDFFFDLLVIVR